MSHPEHGPPHGPAKHIVDILIEERAEEWLERPIAWSLIKRALYPILRYREARAMADAIAPMGGRQVMDYASGLLSLDLTVTGTEHIPRTGRFILVANHPTGIVDGLAVHDAIKTIRPDAAYFANRDALRVCPALADRIVPVEWVEESRTRAKTRETLTAARHAFETDRAVVMFPSGRLAHLTLSGLRERPWLTTTINLMRRYNAPVVPLHIKGRNSWLYYFFHFVNAELRNMTLFYEMLNKKGAHYDLMFGAAIPPEALGGPPEEAIFRLQRFVETGLRQGRTFTQG